MKCQNCNQNEATIQLYMNMNGQKMEMPLCADCYAQLRASSGARGQNSFYSPMDDFFANIAGQQQQNAQPEQKTAVKTQVAGGGRGGLLGEYGTNLTALARDGKLDPVIGRDDEIRRVIEILNRRNKNNPVLIGEPGVGKTAVVEGLANAIIAGTVPSKLQHKEVILLDVASLVSNTGIRGQFEERMKQLITELQADENTILFIDEVHTIVGAGSAEGSMDAGNILKPALARGDLQMIGATTLKEYRKIEKDAALERRFQPVIVDEPTTEEALTILQGLQSKYEEFHHVHFAEDAIEAAVTLSDRYIQDRHLPDKAIDLMDEIGSKYNLTLTHIDPNTINERIIKLEEQKDAALRNENYEEAASVRDEITKLKEVKSEGSTSDIPTIHAADIQALIEEKTGIPVGRLQADEQSKMKNLESNLQAKVIGQEEAVTKVAKAIRRSRVGLKQKDRPIGSFLFVGPTGVGKTELGRTLASEMFGSEDAMIRLDMSEYMEKHSVSKLIGSPPGYVGHEEAGQLTEKVRRNPYSIILLDEMEKAHPDVQHMFLQILEDGRLTDSQGRTVSFKDTVIIMTSNAGAGISEASVGFATTAGEAMKKESQILDKLGDYFKPEFLNRLDAIVTFQSLAQEHLLAIVDLMLADLNHMLAAQEIALTVNDDVKVKLAEIGYDPNFGARPLRRTIQSHLEDAIADFMIEQPDTNALVAVLDRDEITVQAAE
ncbi:ATP-dependent Clp protease ATP-binding subunit [Listeria grandensis]|uniref:ATP-dependent Clp protease ATP-binding subunit n=1 Tax=Listeria grandensis TaxID=1494963 RepID=UPI00164DC751|nr:ATP-dependent Clp protease ATP-binding subunit [Listeria grandensis]MBC6314180.1 AAA domain-containing protein [Listeria grandensis]